MSELPTKSSRDYWSFYQIWAYLCGDLDAVEQVDQLFESNQVAREKKVIDLLEGWDPDRSFIKQLLDLLSREKILCSATGLDGQVGERIQLEGDHWYGREFRYPPPEAFVANSPTSAPWLKLKFYFKSHKEGEKAKGGRPNGSKYDQWIDAMHKRIKDEAKKRSKVADEMGIELHRLDPKKYTSREAAKEGLLKAYRKKYGSEN